jgi:hypothetical protein
VEGAVSVVVEVVTQASNGPSTHVLVVPDDEVDPLPYPETVVPLLVVAPPWRVLVEAAAAWVVVLVVVELDVEPAPGWVPGLPSALGCSAPAPAPPAPGVGAAEGVPPAPVSGGWADRPPPAAMARTAVSSATLSHPQLQRGIRRASSRIAATPTLPGHQPLSQG